MNAPWLAEAAPAQRNRRTSMNHLTDMNRWFAVAGITAPET
jgi:hypothetical protein